MTKASKINVSNQVREYPDEDGMYHTMIIRNHWNYRDRVVLEIDGKSYVFIAQHIEMALRNATNAH